MALGLVYFYVMLEAKMLEGNQQAADNRQLKLI
jgi:hypothetical protein